MINLNQSEVKFQKVVRTAPSCSVNFELDDKVCRLPSQSMGRLSGTYKCKQVSTNFFCLVCKPTTNAKQRIRSAAYQTPWPSQDCVLQCGCGNFLFSLVAPAGFLHRHYRHELTFIRSYGTKLKVVTRVLQVIRLDAICVPQLQTRLEQDWKCISRGL